MEPKTKWKIPPVKVDSDDCAVYTGRVIEDGEIKAEGEAHYVHKGEWVELRPTQSMTEMMAMVDIQNMVAEGSGAMRKLCEQLSERVTGWNWTGMDSKPLLQPNEAPEVLEGLTSDELLWLMSAAQGKETSVERKND